MSNTTRYIFRLLSIILVLCGVVAMLGFYPTLLEDLGEWIKPDHSDISNPPTDGDTSADAPSSDVPSPDDPPADPPPADDPPADPPADPPPAESDAIVFMKGQYYTYAEMKEDLEQLAAQYGEHMSYRKYGTSVDGRNLYVATLGNPDAPKQVIITAGMHAREYVNCYVVMRQLEYYLENYDTLTYEGQKLSELLQEVCLVIAPMTNPDGITIAQEGLSALRTQALRELITDIARRKSVSGEESIDAYLNAEWKSNARGVDINRNFNALWSEYNDGVYEVSNKNYKGPMAGSEPETVALMTLTESLTNPIASVCMHMQGEVIYWRCLQEGELLIKNQRLAEIARSITGYFIIDEVQTEPSYSNWTILAHDIPTITIETGKSSYPLSYAQLAEGIYNENRNLWAALVYEYANE